MPVSTNTYQVQHYILPETPQCKSLQSQASRVTITIAIATVQPNYKAVAKQAMREACP